MARGGYNHQIQLSYQGREDLEWWVSNLPTWNRKQPWPPPHSLEIETDASQRRWGACCDGILTGGCWSVMESTVASSTIQNKGLCQEQLESPHLASHRQHHHRSTHKPPGRHRVTGSGADSEGALAMVPKPGNHPHSPTLTRAAEHPSRLHVEISHRLLR